MTTAVNVVAKTEEGTREETPHLLEVQDVIEAPPEASLNYSTVSVDISDKPLSQATKPYLPNVTGSAVGVSADSIPMASPEKFLSCRIGHHMCRPTYRCRADAYVQAYDDCVRSTYRVFDCDPGYRHRIVHTCLTRPSWLWAFFNNVLSLCGAGSCRPYDDCVHVAMSCPPGGHRLPSSGTVRIGCGPSAVDCDDGFNGRYELPNGSVGAVHELCIPLQPQRIVHHCVRLGLATPRLYMRCRRLSDDSMCLEGARVTCYLRPQTAALIDPHACARRRAVSGCDAFDLEPHQPCASFADDTEREQSNPNQHLEETKLCVTECISKLAASHSKWRLVAYIGRTMIANCGTDSASAPYRIGAVTEVPFIAALLKRCYNTDLHSPETTERLLNDQGATEIVAALKACYSLVADGSIPTPYQLIQHTSGLPSHATLTLAKFARCLRGSEHVGELNAEERLQWVARTLRECRPLCQPGVQHYHSHLNTVVLRYMLPDWRSDDCSELRSTCSDLGMPAACLSIDAANHANCDGPISCETELSQSPLWKHHVYSHATGLSMRTTELATFLSAHGCKHSWTDGNDCLPEYSFMPSTCMPAVTVHRAAGVAYGWGWYHGSVLKDVKAYGKRGLRVMVRCGETLSGHTTIACRVPSMNLSFAFNMGAPLQCITGVDSDRAYSCIFDTVGKIIRALLTPMHAAGSLRSERARFWNPAINEAMSQMPSACPHYGAFMRECAHKYPYFSGPVPSLRLLVEAGEMISATDGSSGPMAYKICIKEQLIPRTPLAEAVSDTRQLVRYILYIKNSSGDIGSHVLAYDPDACATTEDAELFARQPRSHRSGCFRTVCPSTGLLQNYVGIYRAKFGSIQEPCVVYDGRIFLKENMYEAIRRRYAPTEREVLVDSIESASLGGRKERKDEMSLGELAIELAKAHNSASKVPTTTPTEWARWRHGGGLGFGAGLIGGALLGGALAGVYRPWYGYGPLPYGYYNPCPPGMWWDPRIGTCRY